MLPLSSSRSISIRRPHTLLHKVSWARNAVKTRWGGGRGGGGRSAGGGGRGAAVGSKRRRWVEALVRGGYDRPFDDEGLERSFPAFEGDAQMPGNFGEDVLVQVRAEV